MINITPKQWAVMVYLKSKGDQFVSPTQIGHAVWGHKTVYGSPQASPVCKRLVGHGLLERSDRGHYKLTDHGYDALKESGL